MRNHQQSLGTPRLGTLQKLKRSCLKTILAFPLYLETHDGWRKGLRSLPDSCRTELKARGISGILKRVRYYRTLAGSVMEARPPWEEKPISRTLDHQSVAISFVIPVDESTSAVAFNRCVQSVVPQAPAEMRLFAIGPATVTASLQKQLMTSKRHPMHVEFIPATQISQGLNLVHQQSASAWIGILEPHCLLRPDILAEISLAARQAGNAVWIYPDAVKFGVTSRFEKGLLRPDYSSEFLLSQFFTEGFNLVHQSVLRNVENVSNVTSGASVYDLMLHLSETVPPERVWHVPRVWLEIDEEIAPARVSAEAHRQAVSQALIRRGDAGRVSADSQVPHVTQIEWQPRRFPAVNIFLSTRNSYDLVKTCVDSIRAKTSYPNYRIVVIDNQSDQPELLEYLHAEMLEDRLTVFRYDRPFNHSEMHNWAIDRFPSELLVLMNNDIEIITDCWLEQLVASLEIAPEIGGVGPLLLYPDGTIQHAGVILGAHGGAGHFFRGQSPFTESYLNRAVSLQRLSACTAALLLLKSDAYRAIGGFNAERYPESFNDVDLWLRLQDAGYRCLYNPAVKAYHYESKTRPLISQTEHAAVQRLREEWGARLLHDPFHHPAISIENELLLGFRSTSQQSSLSQPNAPLMKETRRAA